MSGFWEKMSEKELKNVKGAGNPCGNDWQMMFKIVGGQGSCRPAYEISHPKKDPCKTVGHGCTAKMICK